LSAVTANNGFARVPFMLLSLSAASIGLQLAVVPGVNLALSDVPLGALMLVLLVRHRAALVSAIKPRTPVHAATVALLGALLWGSAVTYARTGELARDSWLNKDLGWLVLAMIVVAVRVTVQSADEVARLLRWMLVGGVALELIAAVASLAGVFGTGLENLRFAGFLLNPNANGIFIALLLVVLIGSTRNERIVGWNPWTVRVMATVLTLLLLATLSRGTWIAAIVALGIVSVTLMRTSPWLPALCAVVLLIFSAQPLTAAVAPVISQIARGQLPVSERDIHPSQTPPPDINNLIVGVTPPPTSTSAVRSPSEEASTAPPSATQPSPTQLSASPGYLDAAQAVAADRFGASDRIALNVLALRLWFAAPLTFLTGIGLGVFARVTPFFFGVTVIIHSTYLWLPVEMGLPGLIALCALLIAGVWVARRCASAGTGLAVAVGGGLLVLALWSAVNEGSYQRSLWFLLALGSVLIRPEAGPND
jgi:hypothetical protein